MNSIIAEIKKLSPKQQLVLLAVVAILLFLFRHILLLIVALVAIGGLLWFLSVNQAAFKAAFCSFGICI